MESTAVQAPSFPADPWAAFDACDMRDALDPGALQRCVSELLADQLTYRGAPRDAASVQEFLERFPPLGDVLVHGAGSHTARILPLLESLEGVRVVGVVDKLADTFEGFLGYPVVTPAKAATLAADCVLLSNELWEMQMRSALLEAGVPGRRIRGIYSDPRYRTATAARHAHVVDTLPANGCDFAIIDFARTNQRIVAEDTLARALPPDRTVKFFSQRFGARADAGPFPSIGFRNSLDLLSAMLERANPKLVYLRTFVEDNLSAALVRSVLPNVRVIHEVYDWSVTIEPSFLRRVHGHTEASIQGAMAGELFSLRESDLVISKRGGSGWERVLAESNAENAAYFPQLSERLPSAPNARRDDGILRVVYAGNLPAPNTLDIDMIGSLFPLFESLTRADTVQVSVFNGSHADASFDARFAHYMESAGPRLRYHRALPYTDVLDELATHDYGWMYFPRNGIDFIDELVLISNKFTGYISAGLPLIIDDGWEYMAALVRRFDAGIVHSMHAPDELAAKLDCADIEAHRRGVLALRDHLITANETVVERLSALVSKS